MTILATIQAMGDPTRFAILHLVRTRERAAGEIARKFDVTRPAISQHLRILRRAGLLTERREGTKRLYSLRPEGLDQLRSFIEEFWDVRLLRLKRAAEAAERRRKGG
ncbi:MAG TPA: metalloregulator ArsR/SmtB family transcription factor [Xanthobacteraceae bacterium]|nr:metalloregulator ArsR/SmtB family transcription factor [Xanthobacteraceae bacterium]